MCLIMTIATALAFTALWANRRKSGRASKSLFTATLMFWAAALMWSVDGIASVLGGEAFFDLSASDAVLGVLIVASGALVFALLSLRERKSTV